MKVEGEVVEEEEEEGIRREIFLKIWKSRKRTEQQKKK